MPYIYIQFAIKDEEPSALTFTQDGIIICAINASFASDLNLELHLLHQGLTLVSVTPSTWSSYSCRARRENAPSLPPGKNLYISEAGLMHLHVKMTHHDLPTDVFSAHERCAKLCAPLFITSWRDTDS